MDCRKDYTSKVTKNYALTVMYTLEIQGTFNKN